VDMANVLDDNSDDRTRVISSSPPGEPESWLPTGTLLGDFYSNEAVVMSLAGVAVALLLLARLMLRRGFRLGAVGEVSCVNMVK